jgi:hypothetical protein
MHAYHDPAGPYHAVNLAKAGQLVPACLPYVLQDSDGQHGIELAIAEGQ